ncbi:CLIP-domain serine protease subfamily C [Anopheles darlingi]|uniref:CLIP-domain serine protease subfamily C n=1 Tax=Anopheles darlingi TaxID=43151 RepID=W5JW04_ANODA|nr:CLIP-domain serine protease subfamily C [Anopheles darlingi]
MSQFGRAVGRVSCSLLLLATFCSLPLQTHSNTLYEGDACKLRDGSQGVCTKAGECQWFINTILRPRRFKEAVRCSFLVDTEVVCCKRNWIPEARTERSTEPPTEEPTEIPTEPPTEPPTQTVPIESKNVGLKTGDRSRRACEQYSYESQTYNIINGQEAAESEYPFMAALGYPSNEPEPSVRYRCGASLISANFLLTAAHCKKGNGPTTALLGTVSIAAGHDGIEVGVKRVIAHKQYRSSSKYHDIALVELQEPVEYNILVMPICLHDDPQDLPENSVLSAEGFGIVDENYQLSSTRLMKVNLTTVPRLRCNQIFGDANLLGTRKLLQGIVETQYCTIGSLDNKTELRGDACQGDSGGPVQIKTGEKYRLVGVISFGHSCGSYIPGVTTRVAAYIDWIESIVWA